MDLHTHMNYGRYNMVTFMVKGDIKERFVALCPTIVSWLLNHGYKPYRDDYSSIDCIFARSRAEYKMIHAHEIMNP